MTDLPAAGDVLGTPAPVLSPDRVTALIEAVWRLPAGTVRPLTSERSQAKPVTGRFGCSRRGLPMGSGAIESAIRRVINLRLKGNSIFWAEENAEGMLQFRRE